MNTFNKDSRVKIPALLHLARLVYRYLSRKEARWDTCNNIFLEIFESALLRINLDLRCVNDEDNEEAGEHCAPGDGTALGNRIADVPNGNLRFVGNPGQGKGNIGQYNVLSDYRMTA